MRILTAAAMGLVFLMAGLQLATFFGSRTIRDRVDSSYERQFLLDRALLLLQDIETGQRGFALTGNPDFLQPYVRATGEIETALERLGKAGESQQQVEMLRKLSAEKVAISEAIIAARRDGDAARAEALVAGGQGKKVMDDFREAVGAMRAREAQDLDRLLRSSASSNYNAVALVALLQLLLTGMLAAAFSAYRGNLKQLRRVTEEAKDMSERQVAIFEAASDAMMVVDRSGRIESLNRAACDLFGGSYSGMIGKFANDLFAGGLVYIHGLNEQRADRRLNDAARQMEGIREDGSRFVAEVSTDAVSLRESIHTLLIVRDATERSRMENMKSEFVSTVSHELRTPLTSIRGAIGLLDHSLGPQLDYKPKQLLKIAKSNAERLSLLIDDILDVEKLGSGRIEFDLRQIDLRDVIRQAEEQNRTYASQLDVRLLVTTAREALAVQGDPSRLLQALTNLISNAAKFSPKGGEISVIAEQVDQWARVSVADQGSGIPVEFRSRIFERFSQAKGQSGSRSGTGLGLAISKAIVERHGGKIAYETGVGIGTKFWIDLPIVKQRGSHDAPS